MENQLPQRELLLKRDVLIVPLPGGLELVFTCDVAGGVGPKPRDGVPAPAETVGRFTTRVALLELLACRARPLAVLNGLAVEPDPTGRGLLSGIRAEMAAAGYSDLPVFGSMEKNLPTVSTGIAVTAAGLRLAGDPPVSTARPGDVLLIVGVPRVGGAVHLDDPEIADVPTLLALLAQPGVHAVIPAGSGGVAPECQVLAAEAGCHAALARPVSPLLYQSAGPATVLVAAVAPGAEAELAARIRPPLRRVGHLAG
ncbi:MAG: AIR synthase related protein [Symbiobacteriia bacterium]